MYGLCFRCSLAFVVELVERSIDPADLKIDFVVESGHPNAGACKSITDRIVQGKHKRWTLYRVNEIGDKGKLLGTYQGRGHANKALKKIAYAPEPL